jgi:hypothetical protein
VVSEGDMAPVKLLQAKNKQGLERLENDVSRTEKIVDLTPEQQNLFNFLKLIVDIKYRRKYGEKIEQQNGKGYSTYDVE